MMKKSFFKKEEVMGEHWMNLCHGVENVWLQKGRKKLKKIRFSQHAPKFGKSSGRLVQTGLSSSKWCV